MQHQKKALRTASCDKTKCPPKKLRRGREQFLKDNIKIANKDWKIKIKKLFISTYIKKCRSKHNELSPLISENGLYQNKSETVKSDVDIEKMTLIHYWWNCLPLCKKFGDFSKIFRIQLSFDPEIPVVFIYPKKINLKMHTFTENAALITIAKT